MNILQKTINRLFIISALTLAQARVASADLIAYERWHNPKTGQTIHEFHDIHASPVGFADKIKQQNDIIAAAKKLSACILVEDHLTWHKTLLFDLGLEALRPLGKFKNPLLLFNGTQEDKDEYFKEWQRKNRATPTEQYGKHTVIKFDSTIYGLEELCKNANVPVVNIENRFGQGYLGKNAVEELDKNIIETLEKNKKDKDIFLAAGSVHIQNISRHLKKNGYQQQEAIFNSNLKNILASPAGKNLKVFFTRLSDTTLPKAVSFDELNNEDMGEIITHQIDIAAIFTKPDIKAQKKPAPAKAAKPTVNEKIKQDAANQQKGAALDKNAGLANVKHGAEAAQAQKQSAAAPASTQLFTKEQLFAKKYKHKTVDLVLDKPTNAQDRWSFEKNNTFVRGEVVSVLRKSEIWTYGVVLSHDAKKGVTVQVDFETVQMDRNPEVIGKYIG